MEIPKDILEKWKALKATGDPKKIVESMPDNERVVIQTIHNAFNDGHCSEAVFKAMGDFYKKRADTIAQYL